MAEQYQSSEERTPSKKGSVILPIAELHTPDRVGLKPSWEQPIQTPKNWKHYEKYFDGYVPGSYRLDQVENAAAIRQSSFARAVSFVPRLASTAVMEATRFFVNVPAGILGIGSGIYNEISGDSTFGETLADWIDNPVTKFLYDLENQLKDYTPVLYRNDYHEKGWWGQVWTSEFFGDEFAQGAGFFVGNLIPAFITRGASLRFVGLRGFTPASLSQAGQKLTAMRLAQVAAKPTLNIMNAEAAKTGLLTFTIAQSMSEAAAETYFAMETLRSELEQKVATGEINPFTGEKYDLEDLQEMEGQLAKAIYGKNMGLLMFTNYFMNKMIFGARGISRTRFLKMHKDASKSLKWYETIGAPLSKIGSGVINEGFLEEGFQTAFEQNDVHAIINKQFNFLESIHDLPLSYTDMIATKEGAKAIWIGGILGGMGSTRAAYREWKGQEEIDALDKIRENVNSAITDFGKDVADIFERDDKNHVIWEKNQKTGRPGPRLKSHIKSTEKEAELNTALGFMIHMNDIINDDTKSDDERARARRTLDNFVENEILNYLIYYASVGGRTAVDAWEADYDDIMKLMDASLETNLEGYDFTPQHNREYYAKKIRSLSKHYRVAKALYDNMGLHRKVREKNPKNDIKWFQDFNKYYHTMTHGLAIQGASIDTLTEEIQEMESVLQDDSLDADVRKQTEKDLELAKQSKEKAEKAFREVNKQSPKQMFEDFEHWRTITNPQDEKRQRYYEGMQQTMQSALNAPSIVLDNIIVQQLSQPDSDVWDTVTVSSEVKISKRGKSLGIFTFGTVFKSGDVEIFNTKGERYILRKEGDTYTVFDSQGKTKVMTDAGITVMRTAREILESELVPKHIEAIAEQLRKQIDSLRETITEKRDKLEEVKSQLSQQADKATAESDIKEINKRLTKISKSLEDIEKIEQKAVDFLNSLNDEDAKELAKKYVDGLDGTLKTKAAMSEAEATTRLHEIYLNNFMNDMEWQKDDVDANYDLIKQRIDPLPADNELHKDLKEIEELLEARYLNVQVENYATNVMRFVQAITSTYLTDKVKAYNNIGAAMLSNAVVPQPMDKLLGEVPPTIRIVDLEEGSHASDDLQTEFTGWESFLKINYNHRELNEAIALKGIQGLDPHEKASLQLKNFIYDELGSKDFPPGNLEAYAVTIENIDKIPLLKKLKKEDRKKLIDTVNFYAGRRSEYGEGDQFDVPKKFAISKKASEKEGTEYKEISVNDIDLEKSDLEGIDANAKVIVLEQKGRNIDGIPVGTVRIITKDGAETFDVFFKSTSQTTSTESVYITKSDYELNAKDRKSQAAAGLHVIVFFEFKDGKVVPLQRGEDDQWLYSYLSTPKHPFRQSPTGYSKFSAESLSHFTEEERVEAVGYFETFLNEVRKHPKHLVFGKLHKGFSETNNTQPGSEFIRKNYVQNSDIVIATHAHSEKDEDGRQEFRTPEGMVFMGYKGLAYVRVDKKLVPIIQPSLIDAPAITKWVEDLLVYIAQEARALQTDAENEQAHVNNMRLAVSQISELLYMTMDNQNDGEFAFYIDGEELKLYIGKNEPIALVGKEDLNDLRKRISGLLEFVVYDKRVSLDNQRLKTYGTYVYHQVSSNNGVYSLEAVDSGMSYASYMLSQQGFEVYGYGETINMSATFEYADSDLGFYKEREQNVEEDEQVNDITAGNEYTLVINYDENNATKRGLEKGKRIFEQLQGEGPLVEATLTVQADGTLTTTSPELNKILASPLVPTQTYDMFVDYVNGRVASYGMNVSAVIHKGTEVSTPNLPVSERATFNDMIDDLIKKDKGHRFAAIASKGEVEKEKLYNKIKEAFDKQSDYDSFAEYLNVRIQSIGGAKMYKNSDEYYTESQLQDDIKWAQSVINGVTIQSGPLDADTAAEVFDNLTIIYNQDRKVPKGAIYHEAYHTISLFFLSEAERKAIYDEWRKKNKSTLEDDQVEEKLAEEFREYMMTGELESYLTKDSPKKRNWFQKLVDYIIKVLGLNKPTIKELFQDIRNGVYAKAKPKARVIAHPFKMKIPNLPLSRTAAIMNQLRHRIIVNMNSKVVNGKRIVDAEKVMAFKHDTRIYNLIHNDILEEQELKEEGLIDDATFIETFFGDLENPVQAFEEAWPTIAVEHQNQLISIGIQVIRDDAELENDSLEDQYDNGEVYRDMLKDPNPMKNLENHVKLTLLMVPEFDRKGKPIEYTYNSITKTVAQITRVLMDTSEEEFMANLKNLGNIYPEIKSLYDLLDGDNIHPEDKWMVPLRNSFFTSLHKSWVTSYTVDFSGNGIRVEDHYLTRTVRAVKNKWKENVRTATNGIFSKKDYVDLNKPFVKIGNNLYTISDVKLRIARLITDTGNYEKKAEAIVEIFEALHIPVDIANKNNLYALLRTNERHLLDPTLWLLLDVITKIEGLGRLFGTTKKTQNTIPRNRFIGEASAFTTTMSGMGMDNFQRAIDLLSMIAVRLSYGSNPVYIGEGKLLNAFRYPHPLSETFSVLTRATKARSTAARAAILSREVLTPLDIDREGGTTQTMGSLLIKKVLDGTYQDQPLMQVTHIRDSSGRSMEIGRIKNGSDLFLNTIATLIFSRHLVIPKTGDRDNIWAKKMPSFFTENTPWAMKSTFVTALRGYLEADFYQAIEHINNQPTSKFENYSRTDPNDRYILGYFTRFVNSLRNSDPGSYNRLSEFTGLNAKKVSDISGNTIISKINTIFDVFDERLQREFAEYVIASEQAILFRNHPALRNPGSTIHDNFIDAFKKGKGTSAYEDVKKSAEERNVPIMLDVSAFYVMRLMVSIVESSKIFFTDVGFLKDGSEAIKRFHGVDSTVLTIPTGPRVNEEMAKSWPTISQLARGTVEPESDIIRVLHVKDSQAYISDEFERLLAQVPDDSPYSNIKQAYSKEAAKKMDGTDGGSRMTLDLYRRVRLQHGVWDDYLEQVYQYQMQFYFLKLIDINNKIRKYNKENNRRVKLLKLHDHVIDDKLFMRLFKEHVKGEKLPEFPVYKGKVIRGSVLDATALKPIKPKGFDRQFYQEAHTTLINYDKHSISAIMPSEHYRENGGIAQSSEFYATLDYLNDNIGARYYPSGIKVDREAPSTIKLRHQSTDKATILERHIRSLGIQVPEPTKRSVKSTNSKQQNNLHSIDMVGLQFDEATQSVIETSSSDQAKANFDEYYRLLSALTYNKGLNEFGKLGLRPKKIKGSAFRNVNDIEFTFDPKVFRARLESLFRTKHIDAGTYNATLTALDEKYSDITIIRTGDDIIASILAVVRKSAISTKINGSYEVQISDGHNNDNSEMVADFIFGNRTNEDQIASDGELDMFVGVYDSDGNLESTLGMEVRIPLPENVKPWIYANFTPEPGDPDYNKNTGENLNNALRRFKRAFEEDWKDKDGKSIIPKALREGFIVRVPHDGRHQSAHIRIKQYYMPWESYAIRVPTAATKMFGFDFDYDKLHVYLYKPQYGFFNKRITFPQHSSVRDSEQTAVSLLSSPADLNRVLEEYESQVDTEAAAELVEKFWDIYDDYLNETSSKLALQEYKDYITSMLQSDESTANMTFDKYEAQLKDIIRESRELKKEMKQSNIDPARKKEIKNRRTELYDLRLQMEALLYGYSAYMNNVIVQQNVRDNLIKALTHIVDNIREDKTFFSSDAEIQNRMLQLRISMFKQNPEVIFAALAPTDPGKIFTDTAVKYLEDADDVDLEYFYSPANLANAYAEILDKAQLIGIYAVQGVEHGKLQRNPEKLQLSSVVIPFVKGAKSIPLPKGSLPITRAGYIYDSKGKPITIMKGSLLNAALDFLKTIEMKDLPLGITTSHYVELFTMFATEGIGQTGPMAYDDILSLLITNPAKMAALYKVNPREKLYNLGVKSDIIAKLISITSGRSIDSITFNSIKEFTFANFVYGYFRAGYKGGVTDTKGRSSSLELLFKYSQEGFEELRGENRRLYIQGLRNQLAMFSNEGLEKDHLDRFYPIDIDKLKDPKFSSTPKDTLDDMFNSFVIAYEKGYANQYALLLDLMMIYNRLSSPMYTLNSILRSESRNIKSMADLQNYVLNLKNVTSNLDEFGKQSLLGSTQLRSYISYFTNGEQVLQNSTERAYMDIYVSVFRAISELQTPRFYSTELKSFAKDIMVNPEYFGGFGAPEINYQFDRMFLYNSMYNRMRLHNTNLHYWMNEKKDLANDLNIVNVFNSIPRSIIEESDILSSLSPRIYTDTIIGFEREDVGFEVDHVSSIPDHTKLFNDYQMLRALKNDAVNEVLDFLVGESVLEIMLGKSVKFSWLVDQTDVMKIMSDAVDTFRSDPADAFNGMQDYESLSEYLDNIVLNNYYNLATPVALKEAFPYPNYTQEDIEAGLVDPFEANSRIPAQIGHINRIPANRIYTSKDTKKKYLRVNVPLYELIGFNNTYAIQELYTKDTGGQLNDYYHHLADTLIYGRVQLVYKGIESTGKETKGINEYELIGVPKFAGRDMIHFENQEEIDQHLDEFAVAVFMLREAYNEARVGRISDILLFDRNLNISTKEQRTKEVIEMYNDSVIEKLKQSADPGLRKLAELFGTMDAIDVYWNTRKYMENNDVSTMGAALLTPNGEIIDNKIYQNTRDVNGKNNIQELRKVAKDVQRATDIYNNWDDLFPSLRHFSSIMRNHAAVAIANKELTVKCLRYG